jgi:tetratricopeptide (TPR) repeat protein
MIATGGTLGGDTMAVYDAFVSYSHAKDKPIAAALQSVIQRLGKPWYQRRALRVFRDDTSLSATPQLWPSIEQALSQSRFLILLASPEAAASPWVNKEVAYWLEHKSADTLLIAVTDGPLVWENAVGDFVWREGMPLPPVLTGRFAAEPKWVDLTAYRNGADARDSRFIEAGADFAAAIRGMPKEDLLSQELRQQRRALRLAWGAAGSLLILASLAGWQAKIARDNERAAIEQQRIAQQQRDRAEKALAVATETANSLVFDLAWDLRDRVGMPKDLTHRILSRAQDLQRQLSDAGERTPVLRRSEAIALADLVLTHLALGDTPAALAAGQRARTIMQELVFSDLSNSMWQRDLSVIHNRVAEVLVATGQGDQALTEFRRGFAVAAKLVAIDPTNTMWQHDLAVSHGRIGDQLRAAGQVEGALAEYRKSLSIIEELATTNPTDNQWQRSLSVIHGHMGNMLRASGQLEPALASYRASLAVVERLVAADPGNTQWQSDLSISHNRIGALLDAAGHGDEALVAYRTSLAIYEKLSAADPSNAEWQRGLAIIQRQIGEVLAAARRQ